MRNLFALLCVSALFSVQPVIAQSTGLINRPASSPSGRSVLDPNGDGYTSTTITGFGSDDVANSEISFTSVPTFSIEPFGDLRRGPSHLYSDFVPDANGNGVYMHYASGNLIFRFRVGSIMSGSKGYSALIDTDGKFGASGANADPNYQPATTGTNGNPGFEMEVVMETNFRIAVYNVDGSSSPTLVKAYTNWEEMSQVSVAGTFDNGDPDFFIDFYIPFSDLEASPFNLTTSTPLRFCATTVMSPQAAIGGPKSDVYGIADDGYSSTNDEYDAYINAQPPLSVDNLDSGFGSMCTAAPTLNSPIGTGTVNVSGTWTKSSLSGASGTATITVFKNGIAVGTVTNVNSGSTWTLNSVSVADKDVITAKAQAAGESMCLVSNAVTAASCNSTNRPTKPALDCYTTTKGITGTNLQSGWTVHVDNLTTNSKDDNVTNSTSLFAAPTGASPNLTWTYSSGCSGGSPLAGGSYKVYYTDNTSGCPSEAAYVCAQGNGGTALSKTVLPLSVTSPSPLVYTTATTSITGTTDPNAALTLFGNGTSIKTTTAGAGGSFTFSGLNLLSGQQLYILAELNTGTPSSSKCAVQTTASTVICYTAPPVISTDNNNQVTAGAAITGTSGEPVGTMIKIYTSANALVATTTVQADHTWSTGVAGTTPGTYTALAGTSYYATAQNNTCGVSVFSSTVSAADQTASTRCGTITQPVTAGATTVSGTLTGAVTSTIVNLYLDGTKIGSVTTGTTAWSITVSSTDVYANGTLTIGIQESGKQEAICETSATVSCAPAPTAPVVDPSSSTISQNQSVTYTISNVVAGYFYGIADAGTGQSLAPGVWANTNGNLSITTNSFASAGSFSAVVKATSLSGLSMCTSAPATAMVEVNAAVLPVRFISISADRRSDGVNVQWRVADERDVAYYEVERSVDCIHYMLSGTVAPASSATTAQYNFADRGAFASKICYRIRQVDYSGATYYSAVVVVRDQPQTRVQLAPNPAKGQTALMVQSAKEGSATLQLFDVNGRQLQTRDLQLRKGANTIILDGLQKFSGGVLLLKLCAGSGVWYQKLFVE